MHNRPGWEHLCGKINVMYEDDVTGGTYRLQ